MTVKELCALLPDFVKIKILGIDKDIETLPSEPILIQCMGDYEVETIRPSAQDEIMVCLKTQYVKRSN